MKKDDFASLVAGLEEAAAFVRGEDVPGIRVHIPEDIDIKSIRGKLGMSQAAFAEAYGFAAATLRNWEQGRRVPDPSARALLKVIAAEPEMVRRVLEDA